jgi:hypothetical protein
MLNRRVWVEYARGRNTLKLKFLRKEQSPRLSEYRRGNTLKIVPKDFRFARWHIYPYPVMDVAGVISLSAVLGDSIPFGGLLASKRTKARSIRLRRLRLLAAHPFGSNLLFLAGAEDTLVKVDSETLR